MLSTSTTTGSGMHINLESILQIDVQ